MGLKAVFSRKGLLDQNAESFLRHLWECYGFARITATSGAVASFGCVVVAPI
jgi:hypothetical protein